MPAPPVPGSHAGLPAMSDGIQGSGPRSGFHVSQRLRLHDVRWGNDAAPPPVLLHAGRDHARSWAPVARVLRRDRHVIAPAPRGCRDSAWATGGGWGSPGLAQG